jgi:hypothetical protein
VSTCAYADEIHAQKDGNNSYAMFSSVCGGATIRWGMSATPYNNRWRELLAPIAFITGDDTWLQESREEKVHQLIKPPDGQQPWYFKDDAPQLTFQLHSSVIVLAYTTAAESWVDQSELCQPPAQNPGRALADAEYGPSFMSKVSTTTVSEGPPTKRLKQGEEVHDVIAAFVKERRLQTLDPLGECHGAVVL